MRGALPCGVGFEDDGAVEDVSPERKVQVRGWVGGEPEGLHGGEGIDGGEDFGDWWRGAEGGDGGCEGGVEAGEICDEGVWRGEGDFSGHGTGEIGGETLLVELLAGVGYLGRDLYH